MVLDMGEMVVQVDACGCCLWHHHYRVIVDYINFSVVTYQPAGMQSDHHWGMDYFRYLLLGQGFVWVVAGLPIVNMVIDHAMPVSHESL